MKLLMPWIVVVASLLVTACSRDEGTGTPEAAGAQSSESTFAAEPEATGSTTDPAKTADTPILVSEAQRAEMVTLVDQIVAEAADLPRAEFDPAALAKQLGNDPQSHFEWVRDHTWWAPYRGLLRGPKGVMLDRVGSNLDRAVLLGDLLRRSGHRVRLAHSELSGDQARELLAKVRPIPDQRRDTSSMRPFSQERQNGVEDEARALVRSQVEQIMAATLVKASGSAPAEGPDMLAALQDHWWVEYEQDGKWIAMDVLPQHASAKERIANATSTSAWSAGDEFPTIPESDWHVVMLKVVIERYEAGATNELVVLETSIRPADVIDRPIVLGHIPQPWPERIRFIGTDPGAARDAALGVRQWTPLLQIGGETITQSGFNNSGDLDAGLASSAASLVGDQVTSTMDMTLGFGGDDAAPTLSAQWIEYDIRVPGQQVQHLRRPVFDLLGPARRAANFAELVASAELPMLQRAEALLSQTEIQLQACDLSADFVSHLASAGIVSNQAALKELIQEPDLEKASHLATTILDRLEVWGTLPDFGLWRSRLSGNTGEWFIGRPNVLNHRVGQVIIGKQGDSMRHLMDVASNGINVRGGDDVDAFEIRVQQGVADTVAEMMVLGSDPSAAANTASVFGRLASMNSRGFLIDARDDASARQLPWPDDEIARVSADVNAGYMVVVPRQAVEIDGEPQVGWWRVDPASGETIGVMGSGFHGTSEDVYLRYKIEILRRRLFVSYLAAGGGGAGASPMMRKTQELLGLLSDLVSVIDQRLPPMPRL